MNNRQAFITRMIALSDVVRSAYPHSTLQDHVLELYEKALCTQHGYEKVCAAIDWMIVHRGTRDPFPSVDDIRKVIVPETDRKTQAVIVAGRIWSAIGRYGRDGAKEAKLYIGDLGWRVVELQGGWNHLCGHTMVDQKGTFIAQCRQMVEGLVEGERRQAAIEGQETKQLPEAT